MSLGTMSFDVLVAKRYGLAAAVFLNNVIFWLEKNAIDGRNIRDGRVWTYNTQKDYVALMPFFYERQVKYVIKVLKDAGVLIVDQPEGFVRRSWITVSDSALLSDEAIAAVSHSTKLSDGRDNSVPSKVQNCTMGINDTDIKPDINQSSRARTRKEKRKDPKQLAFELGEIRKLKDSLRTPS